MKNDFYRKFEERYRGSRDLIKARLQAYRPFIEPLLSIYSDAKAIDLGCGRGEWLELLRELSFDGFGVDLDDGMLEACRQRGFAVATKDALQALKDLSDESQVIVSGFHIAEHISFDYLNALIEEAFRVLKPAGLLILETPNPENITVGTVGFYMDPTHQKPIPPALLAFLPDYYGYSKVKLVRLQEQDVVDGKAKVSLKNVLSGVSPDYAVVAQKSANETLLQGNKAAFERDYGLTLDSLVDHFDRQERQESQSFVDFKNQVQIQFVSLEQRLATAEQSSAHWQREANAWHDQVLALKGSLSWRLTKPLRTLKQWGTRLRFAPSRLVSRTKTKTKRIVRPVLSHAVGTINRYPLLCNGLKMFLKPFPNVYIRLQRIQSRPEPINLSRLDTPVAERNNRTKGVPPDVDAILEKIRVSLQKDVGQ